MRAEGEPGVRKRVTRDRPLRAAGVAIGVNDGEREPVPGVADRRRRGGDDRSLGHAGRIHRLRGDVAGSKGERGGVSPPSAAHGQRWELMRRVSVDLLVDAPRRRNDDAITLRFAVR